MRGAIGLLIVAGVAAAQTGQPEPGSLRGVVRDSNGQPAAGIAVDAYRGSEPQIIRAGTNAMVMTGSKPVSALTDEAGGYAFTDLAAGMYDIRTERDPSSATPRRIQVEAGKEATLDIVVPAIPTLSGRVLDRNGEPQVDAMVSLITPGYAGGVLKQLLVATKATNEDGVYTFDSDLEANRRYYAYVERDVPRELDLEKRPPIEVPTYYPSATSMDLATPVILRPGENRQKVDIKVAAAPLFCVAGKMASGRRFEIHEAALATTRLVRLRGNSDDQGKYRACGLSAGEYRVSSEHAGREFTLLGSDLEHVDLADAPGHLRVHAEWADPQSAIAAQLDPRSEAFLRGIAARLGMHDPTNDDLVRLGAAVIDRDSDNAALKDAVERGADSGRELGYLVGRLFLGDGLLHVNLTGVDGSESEPSFALAIPSEVLFKPDIPPGNYALSFVTLGGVKTYPKEITYNDVRIADGILRLAPGAVAALHVVMATDMSSVSATVADAEGSPVPGASVVLIPEIVNTAPALARNCVRGQTEQSGSYLSPPLAPGRYRALATTSVIRWSVPEDLDKVLLAALQAKSVEIAPKAHVQITLEPVAID